MRQKLEWHATAMRYNAIGFQQFGDHPLQPAVHFLDGGSFGHKAGYVASLQGAYPVMALRAGACDMPIKRKACRVSHTVRQGSIALQDVSPGDTLGRD